MFLIRCSILNYVNADIEEPILYKMGFKNFTLWHSTKIYDISLYKYLKNSNLQDASGGILAHFVKDGLRFMFT